ncbi:DeoR family transcriptional regulator [Saccharopolyspora erythraea NRRL 2338]|uniref:Lactose phosphotransferase system repressor n=2 Tax=Saccharopolyspora erythraea TaxID=1836 RepID=A4FBL6_SACEN|nr:DeoR/GlpR family DNA-binding transcription regulator [Saccharopolyspora erythraea]EQD87486.1 decarboxylase [Saccharopolyspora erythraea D]PFG95219.1 DeoR family transcriptional regulator [Saccharopolyspora erythraea NRRL 2338]QRK91878.1 DeoR/GlpR transcriptional regulator [Saccharopolyspora erythraea]CAM01441.1 transcriptional regulator, DeoR family [Saccharopolyspora erythraea NRRL 2338]
MEAAERSRAIIERLRAAERVTVAELAEETASSEMTIRRDLDLLAEQGVLRRVRGGAVSLLLRGEATPFAVRERESAEAKRRIAAEAGDLLTDGESVVLDSGTTTLELARVLAHRRLTVIPLDLHSTNALSTGPGVRLLMPGGQTQPGELSFVGHLTETSLRALRTDTAVIGVCGLSVRHGLTAHDLAEVPVKQAAIASARRTIAVCDGTKFGRTGLGHVCDVTALDVVITDRSAPADSIAELEASGVVVRVV